jgi:hypothetical protein
MTISLCSISARLVTIRYSFNDNLNHSEQVSVLLGGFKNPLKPAMQSGFSITTLNVSLNVVGTSKNDIGLLVTQPRPIVTVSVGFDGIASVGAYSNLSLNVATS